MQLNIELHVTNRAAFGGWGEGEVGGQERERGHRGEREATSRDVWAGWQGSGESCL